MADTRALRCWLTSAIALLCCDVIKAAYDRSVCDQAAFRRLATSSPGPPKPPLAASYSVRVEANLLQQHRTLDAHEFYDFDGDRGAVVQWDRGVESRVIFDGTTDQRITVTMPDPANPLQHFTRCEVSRLSEFNSSFVFGTRRSANGTERVFNIGDSFRMAVSQPDVYLGTLLGDNGVWVEGWQSCLYLDNLDATFNATWYFTANNTWTTSLGYGSPQAPVSLRITGRVGGAQAHDFDHVYSFSEYSPQSQDQAAFQTPAGVYCPGQASPGPRPLPNITTSFSFRTEVVDSGTQFINHMAEYYYYDMRVVRYEYQAMQGSVYGTNPLSRIHDFNTGVAYTIDRVRGNCSVSAIQQLGFVGESQDSAFVVMRTAQQFFDLQRHHYVYTGQRTVRDIDCDVWIAVRDDWPPTRPFQTTWEWYFASQAWVESVGYQYEVQLPVMLRVTADDFAPPFERIFNIFDYREKQNQPWDFDVSACFSPQHRKEYTLTIPGNYSQLVAINRSNFLYYFILAVTAHAQVSFMRVSNVQVEHDDNNIYASFSLLDQAPLPGDLAASPLPELSLQQAADKMEADILAGAFTVPLPLASGNMQTLTVSDYDVNARRPGYQEPPGSRARRAARGYGAGAPLTTPSPGVTYTAGAMAGLVVAMIAVGYGLGLGLTLLGHRLYGARGTTEMDNPLAELRQGPSF